MKEESLLLLSDLQKLINQVVLIDYTIIILGDMSLVGTRPPTLDEWEKYEPHHRARMSFRPGLTGLWQVSGRSNITDFEEVVKLDTQYIGEWSVKGDMKIIFRTVLGVIKNDGAV